MATTNNHNSGDILSVTRADQYKTTEELFTKSQPTSSYYTLLFISSLIISVGILIDNTTIVIGGMLVTPVLTPLLVLSLGLAVGEPRVMRNVAPLIGKSLLIIFTTALLLTILFGHPQNIYSFDNTARTAILYFIVAIGSGVAGAFAWIKKELSEVLPGIAIAVSIVPPLALAGVWISLLQFDASRFYFFIFLLNLIGVLLGGLIVFSLLKFYKIQPKIERTAQEKEEEQEKKREEKK